MQKMGGLNTTRTSLVKTLDEELKYIGLVRQYQIKAKKIMPYQLETKIEQLSKDASGQTGQPRKNQVVKNNTIKLLKITFLDCCDTKKAIHNLCEKSTNQHVTAIRSA